MTTATARAATETRPRRRPTEAMLTSSLVVAPLVYLVADSIYAARGWDDPTAAVVHVLGAIAYGFVALCVASWLPESSRLRATVVFTGLVGSAGNVAYGFDAIHTSLGDTALVHQPGAANLIKPLGLFVPLAFAVMSAAVWRLGQRGPAGLLLVAAVVWPIAHIGNVNWLAVSVNVVLVVAFGALFWSRPDGATARPAPGR